MKFAASSAFEADASGTKIAERRVKFVRDNKTRVRLYAIGHNAVRLVNRYALGGHISDAGSVVFSRTEATSGSSASRATTHGGFDNNVPTMESVACGIPGIADSAQLPLHFPPDTETRSATSLEHRETQPSSPLQPRGNTLMFAMPSPLTGKRQALCIGVDAYPNPANRLRGCVADALAWETALTQLGFSVGRLHDGAATRSNIIDALNTMIQQSRSGDILVVQYSGHGTHVPDLDGDEISGQDQAICPVDFEDGQLLIDDDIRGIFERLPSAVHLTCFMDNCFSYSNTRFAVGRAASAGSGSLPRFVVLTPQVVERYKNVRGGTDGARALTKARGGAGTPEEMRWIAFAACSSDEIAYETGGRGDFSNVAVPLLSRQGLTNRQFNDLVIGQFGGQPHQHPKLDCRRETKDAPFLIGLSLVFDKAATGGVSALQPTDIHPKGDRTNDVANLLNAIARLIQ